MMKTIYCKFVSVEISTVYLSNIFYFAVDQFLNFFKFNNSH